MRDLRLSENGRDLLDPGGFAVAEIQDLAVLDGWENTGVPHWCRRPGKTYRELSDDEADTLGRVLSAAPAMERCLRALVARVRGVWDDPCLQRFGALPSLSEDVERIATAALDLIDGTGGTEEVMAAGEQDSWEFYRGKDGDHYWRRKAPNGEVVGRAHEGYRNRADCLANAQRNGYPFDTIVNELGDPEE